MKKLVKILLLSMISLVVLAVVALALIFMLVDPSRYKPAIESVFARQTGMQLTIAGEIDWSFRPVFGLNIQDLRLKNADSTIELASLAEVGIKVSPGALLDGHLEMQEFTARNLHINWIVDANGVNNWQGSNPEAVASTPTSETTQGTTIAAVIERITISNASVAIQDAQRGLNTSFSNLNLSSTDTNLDNRPFPLELSFEVTDNTAGQNASVSAASTASIDFAAGNARFDELLVKLNPLQLSGSLVLQDFRNALAWSGSLSSNTFPLSDFIANYLATPERTQAPVLPDGYNPDSDQFSAKVEFNGNDQLINVPVLALTLDDMQLDADATYTLPQGNLPANLRYAIRSNALDLNRYTASDDTETGAAETAEPATPVAPVQTQAQTQAQTNDTALPVELLQSMNVQGTHTIQSLSIAGLTMTDLDIGLTVQSGRLRLDVQPVSFYNGGITSTITLDTVQNPPSLTSIASIQRVNIAMLAQDYPAASFAEGLLNLESLYSMRGNTVNQLLDSISGNTSFNLGSNAIDIGIIKQVFSSISVLSPAGSTDLAQQWPDIVNFSSLEGHLTLAQGLAQGQKLTLTMDNFEIQADGGIDLPAESFNYNMVLTVFGPPADQTVPVAELYQGVGWPVLCNARFDAPFSQYCGPDFGKVRDLFVQISRNEVQRRVQDAVQEQVPQNLQDSVRNLLNRALR